MATRMFMPYIKYNLPSSLRFSYNKIICKTQPKLYQHIPKKIHNRIDINFNKFHVSHERKLVTNAATPLQKNYNKCLNCLQSKGYIKIKHFQDLIDSLDSTSSFAVSMEQSLFLLESCADNLPTLTNLDRLNLFTKIWSYLGNNNILNQKHYLMALKVLQLNHISVNDISKYINDFDMIMDKEAYTSLIALSCSSGNINMATGILSDMKEKQIPITENIFNYLILGHSRSKNLSGCESVLHLMHAANLKPSTDTKYQLLKAYIENNSLQSFEKLFEECLNDAVIFRVHQIKDLVESAANYNVGIINKLIKMLPNDLVQSDNVPGVLQNLCIKLIYENKVDAAFDILICFPGPKLNEDRDIDIFGVFFINELIRYKVQPSKVIDICSKLNVKNPRALHVACEIVLKFNPNEANMYFEALVSIEPLRPHYFWPILLVNIKEKGEIGIINTLKLMKSLNVELDNETFSQFCLPKLSILLKDESKAMDAFTSVGLKVSQILLPTIEYLIQLKQYDQINNLLKTYPATLNLSHLIRPMTNLASELKSSTDNKNYVKLFASLTKASDDPEFDFVGQCLIDVLTRPQNKQNMDSYINVLKELFDANIKISNVASDVIAQYFMKKEENVDTIRLLSKIINKKLKLSSLEMSTSNIKLPRDMNLIELECHLVELESKNLNTRGVLRKLLQLNVREKKLERALEVLQKCEKLKVHLSGGMLSSIFDLYIKLKDLVNATKTYQQIQQLYPKFNVDGFKIVDFLTLMVEKGELNQAKNFISKHSNSKNVKLTPGKHLDKNVWKLLSETAVLAAKIGSSENEAENLFKLLKNLGYCDYENALLGPIIREYLLKYNLKDAVKEYKNFGENLKKTPLQFELMSLLVHVSNGKDENLYQLSSKEAKVLLQDIVKLSCSIHGINSNSTFLLAIAESGTEEQIRKLLINPEFKFSQNTVLNSCEYLSAVGKTETILKMAKASRGLPHLNEQLLYNTLLDNFRKDNNYSAALELFEKLESEDDLKITQEFLKGLVDLLKINNIQVPTTITIKLRN